MDADLPMLLVEATVAGSAALLLVLALRRPVRALLGASAAYALWLCVPVALLAVSLPRGAEVPLALPVAWQIAPAVQVTAQAAPQQGMGWAQWLLVAWLAGALASMAVLAWQQRRFRGGLGMLRRRDDGLFQSTTATAGLPAVSGVLRPRILLPADFEQRYSAQEQALVLQHERLHVRRGDLLANALAALLRCVFWFNPLLHFALRRFRLDQELACDEWVIARNPRARRPYGEAMLKTQFDELPLPLGCHWQARHPIKERIDMLKRPTPSPMQWMAATFLALALSASAGYAAWAAQPGSMPDIVEASTDGGLYLLARQNTYGGVDGKGVLSQWVKAGEPAVSIVGSGDGQWKHTAAITAAADPGVVVVRMRLEQGEPGSLVAEPVVQVRVGEAAAVEQRDAAGRVIYRSQFVVLPLVGSREQTEARMRDLLASPGGSASTTLSPGQAHAPARKIPVIAAGLAGSPMDQPAQAIERMPPPHYPEEAARHYVGGEVILLVTVAADGTASDVEIEQSSPEGVFDAVSVEAARKWRFRPAMKDGKPVTSRLRIPVTFSTDQGNGQSSPLSMSDFDDYQWMRIPAESVAETVCDAVRVGDAADGRVFCGIRKVAAR